MKNVELAHRRLFRVNDDIFLHLCVLVNKFYGFDRQ